MRRTWQRIYYAIATLRWSVLIAVIVLHALLSYFVLVVTGETALISDFLVYFYYYTTTATTVTRDVAGIFPIGRDGATIEVDRTRLDDDNTTTCATAVVFSIIGMAAPAAAAEKEEVAGIG